MENKNNEYFIFGKLYNIIEIEDIIYSKLYFTYRSNFPKLKNTYLTNDIGWGCTVRSGQMLIGNTLLRKKFGLNWIYDKSIISNEYHKIIYYFQDNYDGIYSIHNLTQFYKCIGHKPGDWIGPYSFCSILDKISLTFLENKIKYYNFIDGVFDYESIEKLDNTFSYFLTFPLRLGLNEINCEYYENILFITKLNYFNGILGGNNKASYFFIGSNNDNLIYLDPHKVYKYNIENSIENEFHTKDIFYLNISELSPTFSISFYCENYTDFQNLIHQLNNLPDKKNQIISLNNTKIKDVHIKTICEDDKEWELID